MNSENGNSGHFPVDPDAPKVYGDGKYRFFTDSILFVLISFMTLVTVMLSIYIIFVKFF